MKRTEAQVLEILEYHQKFSKSLTETAKKFNTTKMTIHKYCKKYGVKSSKRKEIKCTREEVIAHYLECKNMNITAEKYGVDKATVRNWCIKAGIKTSNKKQPRPDFNSEQQKLWDDHFTMVPKIIHKNGGKWRAKYSGMEVEDLHSAGYIGLWRAVLTFDPSKGLAFMTLAYKSIMGEVFEAIEIARYGRRQRGKKLIDHSKMVSFSENPIEFEDS